jgi:GYF domain 2
MQIYISKNNQQTGPFEQAKILEMLKKGQLSPNDLAIRHGEKEWQKLSVYFPGVGNHALAGVAPSVPKKGGKSFLFGCGGFFLVGLIIAGVLGFFALTKWYPAPSEVDLPETIKTTNAVEYKLNVRNRGKGDFWGAKKEFVAVYMENGFPNDYEKSLICLLTVYPDNKAAESGLENQLWESCKKGEKPMRFSFLDANKKESSTGATCAMPFYILKDNKVYAIGSIMKDATKAVANSTGFAESLPFNQGSKMTRNDVK